MSVCVAYLLWCKGAREALLELSWSVSVSSKLEVFFILVVFFCIRKSCSLVSDQRTLVRVVFMCNRRQEMISDGKIQFKNVYVSWMLLKSCISDQKF